ncbi:type IV pilus assembly protein PilA [Neobacillus bataviensis]|uniref:Type IV pilus assembly protein PilA n=1 Tax=Neobacillus bataviensis TaxID=220685 RepID=A0A561DGR6_9BACI|nr:prepilin-type N-terminal cleavage/methylation domain-containing protein [Neobacillus bataviensis]TWE02557.1 type IV pilus assembly protein PilA [Neobacillus bataviensis]
MVQALKAKMKEQKGFTLIELLAVIVILGIIAAIAIPAIGNVISKSDNKSKVQDAIQIIDAAKLYVAEKSPTDTLYLSLNGTGAADGKEATPAALNSYLDRVKDDDFIVKVTYTPATATTAAKYKYSISNHVGAAVVKSIAEASKSTASADEKELVDYTN